MRSVIFRGKGSAAESVNAVFLQKKQRERYDARADVVAGEGLEPTTFGL